MIRTYAASISGNEPGSRAQTRVCFGRQCGESDEFVDDNLDTNELADWSEILSRDSEEESNWIADVTENELKGESWVLDVEISTPPAEKAVDQANKGDDAKKSCNNHARNLDTKPGAIGESVESIRGSMLFVIGNYNTT